MLPGVQYYQLPLVVGQGEAYEAVSIPQRLWRSGRSLEAASQGSRNGRGMPAVFRPIQRHLRKLECLVTSLRKMQGASSQVGDPARQPRRTAAKKTYPVDLSSEESTEESVEEDASSEFEP